MDRNKSHPGRTGGDQPQSDSRREDPMKPNYDEPPQSEQGESLDDREAPQSPPQQGGQRPPNKKRGPKS